MRAGTEPTAAAGLALALALGLGAPSPASAQPSAAAAATLQFDKGRALMKEKKYAEACAAFEQSQKLDPQIGTLFNLGGCYAELGKIASAWNAYREVGQRDANPGRKKEANRRARELEKRLAKLLLTIPSPPPGLVVTMNGADVTALVGADSPVDPAEYKLKATAPGYAAWETTAKIADEGKTVTIAIELRRPGAKEPIKPAPPPAPDSGPGSKQAPAVAGGGEARSPDEGPTSPARPAPPRRKQLAVVVGAAGGASLATGLVFGVLARRKWNDAKALCGGDTVCDDPAVLAQGNALVDDARGRARLSTVLVGGGAILVGAGVALWLTAPSGRASSDTSSDTALRITPELGPGLAGITLGGTFR